MSCAPRSEPTWTESSELTSRLRRDLPRVRTARLREPALEQRNLGTVRSQPLSLHGCSRRARAPRPSAPPENSCAGRPSHGGRALRVLYLTYNGLTEPL